MAARHDEEGRGHCKRDADEGWKSESRGSQMSVMLGLQYLPTTTMDATHRLTLITFLTDEIVNLTAAGLSNQR
eukprot:766154-Hanusia_phi.AAC.1